MPPARSSGMTTSAPRWAAGNCTADGYVNAGMDYDVPEFEWGENTPDVRAAQMYDYQAWLMPQDWADAEGQGWLAAIALEEQPDLCRDVRLLVVDGFDEFNPTQLGVLKALADQVGETMITLTGDASIARERLAHRRFIRARDLLTRSLDVAPTLLSTLHSPHSTFAHLEASLFDSAPRKQLADGAIEFLEAQNRREETRAALRWVKARIVRDGIAPREIAVIARDLDPYLAFLQETASEFGVPLRIAGGLPLASNPCIAALFSLLSLSADGFPRRRVLDAWRSPYFDWSVGQDVILPYADTLDAMTTHRPYQTAMELEEALQLIRNGRARSRRPSPPRSPWLR